MKLAQLSARLPFYYGWVVVAVAFLTIGIGVTTRTSFSLLFPPILDEFGWERGVTAAAFSIGFVCSIVLGPIYGALMDRFGPHLVLPIAAVMMAAGLVTATMVSTPIGLYATFGLLVVGGALALSYQGHSMFVPNWFVRRRGFATGIAFAGVGTGAIIILPWIQTVIDSDGWRTACLALAAVFVVVLLPLNIVFQRRRPADLGLEPDGDHTGDQLSDPETTRRPLVDPVVDRAWAETDWTLGRAVRTSRFWWLFGTYFTALFAWYAALVHQTKYLIDIGFSTDLAAFALGLIGLFGIAGQIGIGTLSDRFGREMAWSAALGGFVLCYLGFLLLGVRPSVTLVYAIAAAQGLLAYGVGSLHGVVSLEIFGGPRAATIYSFAAIGGNLGAASGPWLIGYLFDQTGSYATGFSLCAGLSLLSILCIWMAAPRSVRLTSGQAARRVR